MYLLHSYGELYHIIIPQAILKYLSSNSSFFVLFEHKGIQNKGKIN